MVRQSGEANEALSPVSSEEFLEMAEDEEASASSSHSSNEVASPTSAGRQAAALPVGLQLASRGAGSAPRCIDPLEIRFSQMKMRHLFGDGRRIADTVLETLEERCTEAERAEYGVDYKLSFPFPMIEVIRWRCKIRDLKTGRPKVDKETGEDIYSDEEYWFTLDNRRLYCLQEAAMRLWPQRCVAAVAVIISGPHAHMRELRKFRTLDCGRSAMIGSRADGVVFVRWSWREKAGLDESDLEDSDSEAPQADQLPVPHGRLPPTKAMLEELSVLDHLSTLEPDDYERIELSKKLSWILRHGAWSSEGRCANIQISEDGWVSARDILQIDSLEGLTLKRLQEVITESNKQKWRYETRESKDGLLIRASGRKGRMERARGVVDEKAREPWVSAATPSKGSGAKGGSKGVDRKGGAFGGTVEKENGKSPDKPMSKPPGILEPRPSQPAAVPKEPHPGTRERTVAQAQTTDAVKAAVEAKKAEAATSSKKKVAKTPPGAGVDPISEWMAHMAARGVVPPGVLPGATPTPHLQFMQQMQAMQHMMAIGAMHQMQVRKYMQMQMMRQYQATQAYQMQAMQANEVRKWQEMQAFYESMEWDEEDDEYEEEGDEAAKMPETAEQIEARIKEVLSAAMVRSDEAAKAKVPKARKSKPVPKEAAVDVEAKIAEALQAAAIRNGAARAAAAEPGLKVATPKPARPTAAPDPADMEAKIAEALQAAKSRGAAHFAEPAKPKQSRPPPKKPQELDTSTSIEDKIAKALEAAKERRSTTQ